MNLVHRLIRVAVSSSGSVCEVSFYISSLTSSINERPEEGLDSAGVDSRTDISERDYEPFSPVKNIMYFTESISIESSTTAP